MLKSAAAFNVHCKRGVFAAAARFLTYWRKHKSSRLVLLSSWVYLGQVFAWKNKIIREGLGRKKYCPLLE